MPQFAAGARIDPPVSVPIDSGTMSAMSAAPEPPDEYARSHGLRAGPNPDRTPLPIANSRRFSLPSMIAPARLSRVVMVDSYAGTQSAVTFDPFVVRIPCVARMSFGAYGKP